MSLTEKLAELQIQIRKKIQPEALGSMDNATGKLAVSGIVGRGLKEGDKIPDFALSNAVGRRIDIKDLLAKGPVVLSFYRGSWCPYCNLEMQALQKALPEIESLGATLAAISPQTPDNSLSEKEKSQLTFEVLSDLGNEVAGKFGLVFQLPEEVRPIYQSLGIDLPAHNGDETFELPLAATYVADASGVICKAFVDADYTKRLDPAEVVEALRTLKSNP